MGHIELKKGLQSMMCRPDTRQRGWTLIELMVALTISLVVCLAAMSSLLLARKGFSTVDAASQLRDNARFSVDLIQRLAVQSGFKDMYYAATPVPPSLAGGLSNPAPDISGFDNARIDNQNPLNQPISRAERSDAYGSDILILRYQTSETYPGSGVSDQSMIDCAGHSPSATPVDRHDRMVNIIHVAIDQGEPTLMCSYSGNETAPFTTIPLIQGVENFQVLYGTHNVTAGAPSLPASTAGAPDNFLRADQLIVPGNPVGTNNNWRRVRSLRIGMVLRGPPNTAQEKIAQTLYPLGKAKATASGNPGSAMSSTNDPGTVFKAPADGRLRQVVSFTVHLRNDQGL
jgi:type IV pilus assembly protein PilW